MTGLVLSGGGIKGSYQIGVYYAMLKCHIKFDGFIGTSIGSFNCAMLACGKHQELLDFWYNINVGDIFGLTQNLSNKINDNKFDLGLVKEIGINVKNVLHNKGIDTTGMRKILERYDLKEHLFKSKKDYGLVTVRAKDFKPVYMMKKDIKPYLLNDYILASCYLPVFKFEKIIDENYYLDGGFYDNIPANTLLEKGYDKLYVVDLKAVGFKRPYKDKDKITIIKPSRNLGSILNLKIEDIRNNIKLGYYDTLKQLKNLDGYHYIFKVKSEYYYKRLIKDVPKYLLNDMIKFFRTSDPKKLVIKAVEYAMLKEKYSYYNVYRVKKVINSLNISENKNSQVYKFLSKL